MTTYLFPILTGLFIGTSYIPFPPWAVLFGLVPLIVGTIQVSQQLRNRTIESNRIAIRKAFLGGWIAQFILNAIGFHWISITAVEFGHFPIWAGALVLVGFCSIAHLYYACAPALTIWLVDQLRRRLKPSGDISSGIQIGILLSSFAAIEAVWPSIFPWHLGYTWLWAELPGAQSTDLIGFEGLNLVTLCVNGLFAVGWLRWNPQEPSVHRRLRPTLPWVTAGILLFLAVNVLGLGRESEWKKTDGELKLVMVQGNVGNYEKLIAEAQKDFSVLIVDDYIRLTSAAFKAHPDATFALWPETAFPDYLDHAFSNERNWIALRGFTSTVNKMILTGAYSYDIDKRKSYNGFFAVSGNGTLLTEPYRKSILIPFGEKFPLADIVPYNTWLFPGLGSFGQGPGPSVMNVGAFRLGPQICLESLYPKFSAEMAKKGAEIFTNVTNDSWFGRTFEPYQHMIMTLARAVENRRPLLRSTNTGITTVVLATGEQLANSPIDKEWYGAYTVPYKKNPPTVLYSMIAGYSLWFALFAMLGFLLYGARQLLRPKPDEQR
jgi:apolipoprotein N-acyltransferase